MYTVFIKAANSDMLLDVDRIGRIRYFDNDIVACNALDDRVPIYQGKAVNGKKAICEIANLIHSAKNYSEATKRVVIMDFSKDLDNPTMLAPEMKRVERCTQFSI